MRTMKEVLALTAILLASRGVFAEPTFQINMIAISEIESSKRAFAYNRATRAIGLFQITPVVLKEYNRRFGTRIDSEGLFHADINTTVAHWYMNTRLPELLKYMKIADTTINRLIAYHDGIGNLVKFRDGKRKLGKEMKGYIRKYEILTSSVLK